MQRKKTQNQKEFKLPNELCPDSFSDPGVIDKLSGLTVVEVEARVEECPKRRRLETGRLEVRRR